MKKLILLLSWMMVGCNIEPRMGYIGDDWDVLIINDSTYLMIPKHNESNIPYILNVKDKVTVDSAMNADKRNLKNWSNK